jgi:DNA-binding MurR/RpiR family transcriptional regulator
MTRGRKAVARSYEDLTAHMARCHPELSDRLRRIAEYAVQHPNEMALGTVSSLAQAIGVQPSAMIRFANSLGYDGFTELQQIFRSQLVKAASSPYRDRIASLRRERDGSALVGDAGDVLAEFVADDIAALEALYGAMQRPALQQAVSLLTTAESVYVLAQGRSFPIAFYIDYGLCRLDLKSNLLDGVGGLVQQRARMIRMDDVLLAVSFKDYSQETVRVATETAARGVPLIVITDSELGPFSSIARVCLAVGEVKARPFRSLVAPICLAQSLVVAAGHRLASQHEAQS